MEPQKIDFAKLELDDRSTELLFDFCKVHRLGLADVDDQSPLSAADFKFHVTVIYSKRTNPEFQEGEFEVDAISLKPESFALFGPNADILALKLHPDATLTGLFDHYRSTYGHVSDFMPYRPHVSIRGSNAGLKDRLKDIPLPDFDLRADRIVHKLKIA